MWVGANGAKAEVPFVDEVTIREAEIWADRDSIQVHPSVPELDTEQSCLM
jgi:hypothetical protein